MTRGDSTLCVWELNPDAGCSHGKRTELDAQVMLGYFFATIGTTYETPQEDLGLEHNLF